MNRKPSGLRLSDVQIKVVNLSKIKLFNFQLSRIYHSPAAKRLSHDVQQHCNIENVSVLVRT